MQDECQPAHDNDRFVFVFLLDQPEITLKAVQSDESAFLISCHVKGTAPIEVDLLCDGRVRLLDEVIRDDLKAEITTDSIRVTNDSVCQCIVTNDYGSVQDDVYVNVTGGELKQSPLLICSHSAI